VILGTVSGPGWLWVIRSQSHDLTGAHDAEPAACGGDLVVALAIEESCRVPVGVLLAASGPGGAD